MQICIGTTRVVLLNGSYAYKFARVRPLKTLLKFAVACISENHRRLLKEKYDKRTPRAFWKYFWGGIYSNRAEYRYWRETRDDRCIPVVRIILGGLIVVQPRADTVSLMEVSKSPLAYLLSEKELATAGQYGRINDDFFIIDYAHWRMHVV